MENKVCGICGYLARDHPSNAIHEFKPIEEGNENRIHKTKRRIFSNLERWF